MKVQFARSNQAPCMEKKLHESAACRTNQAPWHEEEAGWKCIFPELTKHPDMEKKLHESAACQK